MGQEGTTQDNQQIQNNGPDVLPFTPSQSHKNGIWGNKYNSYIDKVALHGFTIADLIDLGALGAGKEGNVLPNNLQGPIHPVFALDKWEKLVPDHYDRGHFTLSEESCGQPQEGHYCASDPLVWRALEPCLRLASKFVENAHIFPWYDALLHGEISPISYLTPEAKKRPSHFLSVRLRPEKDFKDSASEIATRQSIAAIAKHIRLGISDGQADPRGIGCFDSNIHYDGVAIPAWEDDGTAHKIYLAHQLIAPLLIDDLRPSTALALQFHVALTLLHEFAHVLLFARDTPRDSVVYFENDRINEAGLSFEVEIFGAHPILLLQHGGDLHYKGALQAGFLLEDWLGVPKGIQAFEPISGTDADWNDREWRECRSMPLSYLEELGQEDFWGCFVRKWGADALKVSPWTEGRLVRRRGDALDAQVLAPPEEQPLWLQEALSISSTGSNLPTPDGARAAEFANRRISRAQDIAVARRRGRNQVKMTAQQKTYKGSLTRSLKTPSADPAEPEKERPWQVRDRHIKAQKDTLTTRLTLAVKDAARVQHFLSRTDVASPDYSETQQELIVSNEANCKEIRDCVRAALDEDLFSGYQKLLSRYESMKRLLGRDSRESSQDRELEKSRRAAHDHCAKLLERAQECQKRGENKLCSKLSKDVLSKQHASQHNTAGANLLLSLCTVDDKELKVWYALEAIRIFKQAARVEGSVTSEIANEKLAYAEDQLKAASADLATEKPEIRFDLTTSFPPIPPRKQEPAPEGLTPSQVAAHLRSFRLINQARYAFQMRNYDACEGTCLELLRLPDVSIWQQARANVFLARLTYRRDRVERAMKAVGIYRHVETERIGGPDEERARKARVQAEELLKRVLREVEEARESSVTKTVAKKEGEVGALQSMEGLKAIDVGSENGNQRESDKRIEIKSRTRSASKSGRSTNLSTSVAVGFVTGIISKAATLLGLKRRREHDSGDDGDGRVRKAARFA